MQAVSAVPVVRLLTPAPFGFSHDMHGPDWSGRPARDAKAPEHQLRSSTGALVLTVRISPAATVTPSSRLLTFSSQALTEVGRRQAAETRSSQKPKRLLPAQVCEIRTSDKLITSMTPLRSSLMRLGQQPANDGSFFVPYARAVEFYAALLATNILLSMSKNECSRGGPSTGGWERAVQTGSTPWRVCSCSLQSRPTTPLKENLNSCPAVHHCPSVIDVPLLQVSALVHGLAGPQGNDMYSRLEAVILTPTQ